MRIEAARPLPELGSPTIDSKNETTKASFSQVLANALGEVDQLQQQASKASIDLAAGKIQDVSEVVIAAEKATIALQLTMQVRNKVIDAYQEVMRMQV